MEIKTNKLLPKWLKTLVLSKPQRRKIALLNTTLKKFETIVLKNHFKSFAISGNKFNEVTENQELYDNLTIGNSPQKSQLEIKRRPNIAITENYISYKVTIVPGDRAYVSRSKYRKK